MSSQALAKPILTKNSTEFNQDIYASLATGDLVLLAVAVIQAEESPAAMEEIVSTCFRLFPHSFALKNYFYWPDSAQVTRHLQSSKEKGLLKGSPTDGYELKGKGKQSAKQTAKTLEVSLPIAPKVNVPAPAVKQVEKKEEPATVKVETPTVAEEKTLKPKKAAAKKKVKTVKKAEAKKKPAVKKQAPVKVKAKKEKAKAEPVKKKPAPKPKTQPKKTAKPVVKPVKQTPKKKAPVAKKSSATAVKVKEKSKPKVEKKQAKPVVKAKPTPKVKPASGKKEVKSAPKAKAQKTKSAAATQLALTLTPPAAKKKPKISANKPRVKKEAQPVKVEAQPVTAVSKEEKDKAGKVIKQLERSDAYQIYKRNGKRAQIGEFDFRNMLFATMESSAETLKRNLELFKRYAGIHFRTDLIAFLEFCEEYFTSLLTVKTKQSFRKK